VTSKNQKDQEKQIWNKLFGAFITVATGILIVFGADIIRAVNAVPVQPHQHRPAE